MDLVYSWAFFATLCIIAVTIPGLRKYFVMKYKLRHLTGPRGLPLLGNLLQFGKDNISFMKQLSVWAEEFRESGYYLLYFGTKPVLMIYNANDVEIILRDTQIDRKNFLYYFNEAWLGNGLLLSEGPKWVSRRKLLTPSFHFSMLENFVEVMNCHAKHLSDKLCGLVEEPKVELLELLSLCSLDILNECMMGRKLGAQQGEGKGYVEAVHRIGGIFTKRFQCPWLWNETLFGWSTLGKEQARVLETLHKTTKKVFQDRKLELQSESKSLIIDDKSQEVRKRRRLAFLDLLIAAQRQDNTLPDEGILEEVDTFMFEGHDTVSSSTTIAMYLIGKHPEIQRKLQEELDEVFGNDRDRPVTMEDLKKLDYLSCVMKEGQRLLTTVPYIGRELVNDISVCGTVIPKDTAVFLGLYWLHRDTHHFTDPEKFDPDRFLPANSKELHHFAYVPFSAGHRNCIGQKFAIMEQKVIMATVLRKISLTSLQTIEELKLANELVLRPTNGVYVKLTLRQ
ncbi:Cytochrome P450 4V2 [Holothuria leucospilota]|uniref:Cytochrome P450 4V2 n=1 Tax=Holothuria leucospilota TaxID=206669 RepID=A0A9Q1BJ92_HOLLE|nr:Cytochrome P450 4V2 [Holothuria leucospilota]